MCSCSLAPLDAVNGCYPTRIIVPYVKIDPPPDVVRIALPTPWPIGPVNVYLLRGEPLTLVDAGPRSPEALKALEEGLAAAGVAMSDIELVVLTHQHHDHVGNAAEVVRRSGARVAAFAPLVEEFADLPASLSRQHDYMACLMARHGMRAPELRALGDHQRHDACYTGSVGIDRPLADGDTVRAGRRLLRGAPPAGPLPQRPGPPRRGRRAARRRRPPSASRLVQPARPPAARRPRTPWQQPTNGRARDR